MQRIDSPPRGAPWTTFYERRSSLSMNTAMKIKKANKICPSQDNTLRILQWNAGGLTQDKRVELMKILQECDTDVFTVVEANRTKDDIEKYNFAGYSIHLLEKCRKVASGILIGIKNTLPAKFEIIKTMANADDKSEITKTEVWKNGNSFKIFSVYNPPNNKPNLDFLPLTTSKTIVVGDFNAHSQKWGYNDQNSAGLAIQDLLNTTNLELIYNSMDTPTYLHYNGSKTNPDLLMVSSDISSNTSRKVRDDPGSGHRIVSADILIPRRSIIRNTTKTPWNFRKAKWSEFTNALETELEMKNFDFTQTCDQISHLINNVVIHCAKKFVPSGKQRQYKPFWNEDLQKLKENREDLRKKAEYTKDPKDVQKWRHSATATKRAILAAKRECFNKFICKIDYKKDSSKTYSFLNKLQNKHRKPQKEPIIVDNKLLESDAETANAFAKYYSNSQKKPAYVIRHERNIKKENIHVASCPDNISNIFTENFSPTELDIAISQLKPRKAPGEDNIFTEYLQHMGEKARKTMLTLFNKVWNSTVPAQWKKATVIPVLKKYKPHGDISNYRPISLTSIVAKTMERMVNNRLNWYLETNNLIHHAQAGFRQHRSTEQQVAIFSQHIKDSLDKGQILTAVYVDFKGAYDSVWKAKLLQKLHKIGIRGNMLNWIKAFTSQRYCRVRYGDATSKYKQLRMGMPQGAVTSCSLFNIYINDLIDNITIDDGVYALLYADDLVFWTSVPKKDAKSTTENALNKALKTLQVWCTENAMNINISKTACQTFSLCHKQLDLQLVYNNNEIEQVTKFKYLGMTFDCRLSWKDHIEEVTTRAQNRLSIIKRLAGSTWGCARSTLNTTYKMFVKPVMKYGCSALITSPDHNISKLDKIQNQALRLVTGAVKTTPIDAMLILTNNKEFSSEIAQAALKLHEKLIRLPSKPCWPHPTETRRLKTQDGFLEKVHKYTEKYNIQLTPENLPFPDNPTQLVQIVYELELTEHHKKADTSPLILLSSALETLNHRYPESEWLHVFTDGSRRASDGFTGAGVYCKLFQSYATLGRNRNAFDGEIQAIFNALQQLLWRSSSFSSSVILSDSKSAIQAIVNYKKAPPSNTILECRDMIRQLSQLQKKIVLQWIPSHCGITGNERADELAKRGTEIMQTAMRKTPYYTAATIIRNAINNEHHKSITNRTQSSTWKDKLITVPDWPRRESVAKFRMSTGHDCLAGHLHRFGIYESPLCNLCNQNHIMDAEHLMNCPALRKPTSWERYWEARDQLRFKC